jgi:hypothetical protein
MCKKILAQNKSWKKDAEGWPNIFWRKKSWQFLLSMFFYLT